MYDNQMIIDVRLLLVQALIFINGLKKTIQPRHIDNLRLVKYICKDTE